VALYHMDIVNIAELGITLRIGGLAARSSQRNPIPALARCRCSAALARGFPWRGARSRAQSQGHVLN
jgi:hypothetical protein